MNKIHSWLLIILFATTIVVLGILGYTELMQYQTNAEYGEFLMERCR